jgi:hypothetical protein
MLVSETEGWSDLVRIHPSVAKLYLAFVAPMLLVPPAMYAYAELVSPGSILPVLAPALTPGEMLLWGAVFFVVQMAMVGLMANYIQQIGESEKVSLPFDQASLLSAVALTPIWLSSLALAIPSVRANMAVLVLAWIAAAVLIRHGIRPLFKLEDERLSHRLANEVTVASIFAGLIVILIFAALLSLMLGTHRVV